MAGQDWMDQGDERRRDIVRFIKSFTKRNSYAPTQREIAEAVGLYKNGVAYHLDVLEKQGKIKTTPHKARSIRVVSKK